MTELDCSTEELKTLFLFESLDDEQLEQLCANGHVEMIEAGPVFAEGDDATCFYVLLDGELVLTKMSGGEKIEVNRTSSRGVYAGAWQAYLGDRAPQKAWWKGRADTSQLDLAPSTTRSSASGPPPP